MPEDMDLVNSLNHRRVNHKPSPSGRAAASSAISAILGAPLPAVPSDRPRGSVTFAASVVAAQSAVEAACKPVIVTIA